MSSKNIRLKELEKQKIIKKNKANTLKKNIMISLFLIVFVYFIYSTIHPLIKTKITNKPKVQASETIKFDFHIKLPNEKHE